VPGYLLREKIGEGTWASVFVGIASTGQKRAIKIFNSDSSLGTTTCATTEMQFLAELQALSCLAHPGIVSLHDFGRTIESNQNFLALDLVEGEQFVKATKHVSAAHFHALIYQLCAALHYLHSKGFVHGDLKPENIIVAPSHVHSPKQPQLKLIDFGNAVPRVGNQSAKVSGTPRYLAPEVIRGTRPTVASDLFSMGAILYESLTGSAPPEGGAGLALQHQLKEHLPVAEATAPFAISSLTSHLLAHDPHKRPSSAAEVLKSVSTLIPSEGVRGQSIQGFDSLLRSIRPDETTITPIVRKIIHCFDTEASTKSLLVVIAGERGSGKTRLLQHLLVRCRSMGYSVPHGPRTFATLGCLEDTISGWTHDERQSPTVIAIDNVNGSDLQGSIGQTFLTTLATLPRVVLMVATADDPANSACEFDLSTALRGSGFSVIAHRLLPWDSFTARTALTEAIRGLEVDDALIEALCQQTGGTQLLLLETLISAHSQAVVTDDTGKLRLRGSLDDVAHSDLVRTFLEASTTSLSHTTSQALTILSAVGAPLSQEDLAELHERAVDKVTADWRVLISAGLIRQSPTNAVTYCVPGTLMRRHALSAMSRDDRLALHNRIARWYARMSTPASLGHAAEHYIAAEDRHNALKYCIRAAHQALQDCDEHRAIHFLKGALSQNLADPTLRLQLTVECARGLTRIGELEEAWRRLNEPVLLESATAGQRAKYFHARARCLYEMGQLTESATWARRARSEARRDGDAFTRISILIELGRIRAHMQRFAQARRLLLLANALARKHKFRGHVKDALSQLAFVHWQRGNYSRALRYARRSLRFEVPSDASASPRTGPVNLGVLHMELGHFNKARRLFREAITSFERHRRSLWSVMALNNLSEVSRHQGRWLDAARGYSRAISAAEKTGSRWMLTIVKANAARIYAHTGNLAESIAIVKHTFRNSAPLSSVEVRWSVLQSWMLLLLVAGRFRTALRFGAFATTQMCSLSDHASALELRCFMMLAHHESGARPDLRNRTPDPLLAETGRYSFDVGLLRDITRVASNVVVVGNTSPDSYATLQTIIAVARKKKMRWHLTWALVLLGDHSLKDNKPDEAEAALLEAAKIARRNSDKLLFWQANYWLGRLYEQKLQYERAYRMYRFAALTIHEMALGLAEEKWRRPFLEQPKVRDLLERFERLRAEVSKKVRYDMAMVSRSERVSRRMLGALSAIGQKLTSILDLNDLLRELLDLSIENVRAERGIVFLADEAAGGMRAAIARGMDKESLDGITSFSRSVIDQVAKGQTLLTIDVGQDPSLAANKSLVLHEIKSILAVPMRHRGKTVGIIYLDTRKGPQLFTDKERAFVESFASQAAIAIENARLFGQMSTENTRLRREAEGRARFENLVGASPAMKKLTDVVASVLESDCNILILGESGTGKELVARALHYNGPRKKKKFMAVDCGALPENLLEAELFGHARGAFTGADRERVGLIEETRGGTLFLDEVTNTSLGLQARLLRALQEREVRRLGENTPRPVDVRIIAATNADIKVLLAQGKFRQDLYYRLNVVSIEVPPLRCRREDIPLLLEHFLRERAGKGVAPKRVAPAVLEALVRHDWPGNVREFANVIERAHILSPGEVIRAQDLPEGLRAGAEEMGGKDGAAVGSRKSGEHLMIEEALRRFSGDKAKTARYIGWNRQKLYRRMKEFGIPASYGRADQAA